MPEIQAVRCGKVLAAIPLRLRVTKAELIVILKQLGVSHVQAVNHHIAGMQLAGWLKKTAPDSFETHHPKSKRIVIDVFPGSFTEDDPDGKYLGVRARVDEALERFGEIVTIKEEGS